MCETCQGGPLAPEPLSIPQAPHPHPSVLHTHYLLSTKGDWPCKCSSKTRPEPPPPTFQPERRPRPHLRGNAGVQQGGLLRRRAGRLWCPVLGGGVARLSLALALRACLSGCLGPSLVLPLCVFVGNGRRCPLGPGKGSGSIEGSWKSGGVRDLSSGLCFCQRRSLPLGTCSPLQGTAPPATRGLPCLQQWLCPRLCVQSSSRALGAELLGSGCRPDSRLRCSCGPCCSYALCSGQKCP